MLTACISVFLTLRFVIVPILPVSSQFPLPPPPGFFCRLFFCFYFVLLFFFIVLSILTLPPPQLSRSIDLDIDPIEASGPAPVFSAQVGR